MFANVFSPLSEIILNLSKSNVGIYSETQFWLAIVLNDVELGHKKLLTKKTKKILIKIIVCLKWTLYQFPIVCLHSLWITLQLPKYMGHIMRHSRLLFIVLRYFGT